MQITRVDVLSFRGATPGARAGTARAPVREGLLLQITLPDGLVAQGEASPLPGYSPESIEEARAALSALDWTAFPEANDAEHALRELATLGAKLDGAPPSVRFAVETAWLDALGQRARRPIWALLGATAPAEVPLSAYVGDLDDPSVVALTERAVTRGLQTIKIKLTPPLTESSLGTLMRVRDLLGARRLRLDANRSLDPSTAMETLERLHLASPELIEEPVPTESLASLGASPIPVALDESLQDPRVWVALSPHFSRLHVKAVVLKPMLLGGFGTCLDLARSSTEQGLDVTVSHLFDGPVALAACAHLALAVASRARASGLDRHAGLAAWPDVAMPHLGPTTVVAANAPGLGVAPLGRPA